LVLGGVVELAANPVVVDVDCDAGDDLATAVAQAEATSVSRLVCVDPPPLGVEQPFAEAGEAIAIGERICSIVPPRPILVNVAGSCAGGVRITADHLTLQGVDARARVSTTDPFFEALVTVDSADHVTIRNLSLENGIYNLRVIDAEDLTVENAQLSCRVIGIFAFEPGSSIRVDNVTISTHPDATPSNLGIYALGAVVDVEDSVIEVGQGIVGEGNDLRVVNTTIIANLFAVGHSGSIVSISGGVSAIEGNVLLFGSPKRRAGVTLGGSFTSPVYVGEFADAHLESTATLPELTLSKFTNAVIRGTVGILECDAVSDAICDSPAAVGTSSCANCPGAPNSEAIRSVTPRRPATIRLPGNVDAELVRSLQRLGYEVETVSPRD